MEFEYSEKTRFLLTKLQGFMDEHVYPNEARYHAEIEATTQAGRRGTPLALIEEPKPKARAAGLWNLFMTPSAKGRVDADAATVAREGGLSNSR